MVELGGAVDAGEGWKYVSFLPPASGLPPLYCTVLYCTVLYCTVLHCTVVWCRRTAPAGVRGDDAGRQLQLPAAARDQGQAAAAERGGGQAAAGPLHGPAAQEEMGQ